MRIQKTFMEQIKDSSTPLNSPEQGVGGGGVGRGSGGGRSTAARRGRLLCLLVWLRRKAG